MNVNAGALGLSRGVREGGLLPHHLLHHHQDVAHLHQAVQHLEQLLSCFCSINDIHQFEILFSVQAGLAGVDQIIGNHLRANRDSDGDDDWFRVH